MKRKYTLWNIPQTLGVATCFIGTNAVLSLPAYITLHTGAGWVPFYAGLVFICLPIIYIQMKLGGSTHKNVIGIFDKFIPFLKGVGLAGLMRSFILSVATGVLASYCFIYAFQSLSVPYKWGSCEHSWNSDKCDDSSSWGKGEGIPASVEYFQNRFLLLTSGVSLEGSIVWQQAAALGGVWVLVLLTVVFGMNIFAMFMAILGGVTTVLAIALIAYTREEVDHMKPEEVIYNATWSQITEPTITDAIIGSWLIGIMQAVGIMKAWEGVLPTIGKYCGWTVVKSNFSWLSIFLALCVLPHLVVNMLSPLLGALAGQLKVPLDEVIKGSPQLLFVHLASALHLLNMKRGIAFLLYLITGVFMLQSQCLWTAVIVDNIVDGTRHSKCCGKKSVRLVATSVVYCIVCYIASLPLITQGGYYLLLLLFHWMDRLLFVLIFFSLIAFLVSFAKAPFDFCNKVVFGIWFTLASLLAAVISGYMFWLHIQEMDTKLQVKYKHLYTYPQWAYIVGWLVAVTPILIGLLFGLMHAVGSASGSGKKRCRAICCGNSKAVSEEEPQKTYATNIQYMG